MGAPAETHVVLWMTPVEPQVVGCFEYGGVAVCRGPQEHQPVSRQKIHPSQGAASPHGPVVELEGRFQPHGLFHEAGNAVRKGPQFVGECRGGGQQSRGRADQRRGRLTPSAEHHNGDSDRMAGVDDAALLPAGERVE